MRTPEEHTPSTLIFSEENFKKILTPLLAEYGKSGPNFLLMNFHLIALELTRNHPGLEMKTQSVDPEQIPQDNPFSMNWGQYTVWLEGNDKEGYTLFIARTERPQSAQPTPSNSAVDTWTKEE